MRNKSIALLFGLALMGGFAACTKTRDQAASAVHMLYHCAMHPQIVSDKPGECPICHMRLVPINMGGSHSAGSERKILFYRNPMNPSATSPVPMKDSMGM